jgi:cytoskeletal protein RodZ
MRLIRLVKKNKLNNIKKEEGFSLVKIILIIIIVIGLGYLIFIFFLKKEKDTGYPQKTENIIEKKSQKKEANSNASVPRNQLDVSGVVESIIQGLEGEEIFLGISSSKASADSEQSFGVVKVGEDTKIFTKKGEDDSETAINLSDIKKGETITVTSNEKIADYQNIQAMKIVVHEPDFSGMEIPKAE